MDPHPQPQPAPLAVATEVRVAFQGEPGAYSEEAIHQLWGPEAVAVPVRTFEDVMDSAETGRTDYGLLPIESTLIGAIDGAYDLLALHDGVRIAAEAVVPVRLALLGIPGTKIPELRTLSSHPVLLAQCEYFLARWKQIRAEPAWDTAGAARDVAERGDRTRAAAGSRRAAERFGLEVLADRIEDRPDSQLRFLAVARDPSVPSDGTPARTAALCIFPHAAGALLNALRPIAEAGFNISHLASRPTRAPWIYQFFLEFEHRAGDPAADTALSGLRHASSACRILGTYARWHRVPTDEDATGLP
ncbi:MAG TPA: prephenate dehydratase domain-containing protein [Gemmatimonadaceae bacterium]|nr:prephenate dehydratase domain-containing protein [Gemmatimonadaceae bacterium]